MVSNRIPANYCVNLGYGSSAVVYNAIYKPLNKQVAVKTIDLDRFERNQIDELRVRKAFSYLNRCLLCELSHTWY